MPAASASRVTPTARSRFRCSCAPSSSFHRQTNVPTRRASAEPIPQPGSNATAHLPRSPARRAMRRGFRSSVLSACRAPRRGTPRRLTIRIQGCYFRIFARGSDKPCWILSDVRGRKPRRSLTSIPTEFALLVSRAHGLAPSCTRAAPRSPAACRSTGAGFLMCCWSARQSSSSALAISPSCWHPIKRSSAL